MTIAFATLATRICLTKSTITRNTLKRLTKLANINVASISSTSLNISDKHNHNVLYTTLLKENSVIDCAPLTLQHQLEDAVKKIKKIMASKTSEDDQLEALIMIDTIQRLGLEYYFHEEIHAALERQYANYSTLVGHGDDLHEVALRFRLLRQEGYDVIADVFSKFKDDYRKFKQELCKDIKGLISLFEASQLSIRGDDILDEAYEFSGKLLKNSLKNVEQSEAGIIRNILCNPSQRSLSRLMAKSFLLDLENYLKFSHDFMATDSWIDYLKDLARMDFNIAKINHQNEITQVSR